MSVQTLHAKAFNTLFKGYKLSTIEEYADLFLSQYLSSMLYHPVIQRLREAQAKGEYTLILSSSPAFLVEAVAQRLQVAHWKATTYHLDSEGDLTAIAHVLEGQDKADYVTALADKMNLPASAITAYSDSYLDLPVLKIAGRAIGVVPDPYLKRICLDQGWEIL
jgi:HAD superfamily phosphoserine phosphatase-like hydrolase